MRYIWKRCFAALLAVALAFALLPATALAEDTPFSNDGGNGQEGSPYLISTAEQLKAFRDYINSDSKHGENQFFKLTGNIDLGGEEWTPIGVDGLQPFRGTFDGNDCTVSGLYIHDYVGSYAGLFGYISGTVKNLTVTGLVTGINYAGGIAGMNNGGTIENCHNAANISDGTAGGIVGHIISGGQVKNSYNSGTITITTGYAGGIAGIIDGGAVQSCYNTGAITCTGPIPEHNWSGGIVGMNIGTVSNCYNTGAVSGSGSVGGVVGSQARSNCTGCFYLEGTAEKGVGDGNDSVDSVEQKSAADFKNLASTLGDGWVDDPFWGRPVLVSNREAVPFTGAGSEAEPYEIPNLDAFKAFRDYINSSTDGGEGKAFKLSADIDLEGSEENQWTPIGNDAKSFHGTFDGGGYTVNRLYIKTSSSNQGLFGGVGGSGKVINLTVKGEVTGDSYVGGIAGENDGRIENCHNAADVTGGTNVGGVVGLATFSTVKDCSNTGTVNGDRYTGGVVGEVTMAYVQNSYNSGNVSGNENTGGIAGYYSGNNSIENCYNTGAVFGDENTGGIVGQNSYGTVKNCYNYGKIGGSSDIGGVVGKKFNGSYTGCYYLDTCGADGEGTAKTAAEFRFLASALGEDWADSVKGRPVLLSNQEAEIIDADVPYVIPDVDTMKAFREYVNASTDGGEGKTFKLTNNIDLGGVEWTPIGSSSRELQGTFDGGNFTVSGLSISTSTGMSVGLFGCLGKSGTVKNLTVEGNVTGISYVGGIVGQSSGGTIDNCHNAATVTGTEMTGGIVGFSNGIVTNCYNTATVTGNSQYIGGIVGHVTYGSVTNCYNIAIVTGGYGDYSVGGIIGFTSSGTVTNCYYLEGTVASGIGGDGEATEKTAEQFASGEVAWLLQNGQDEQVWGQKLSSDNYPVLTGEVEKKVYKVTFATKNNPDYDAEYANPNGTVALPADPTLTEMIFDHWSTTDQIDGSVFTYQTPVTADTTVYAVGRQTFGGGIDAPLSIHEGYSSTFIVDLDIFMAYKSGEPAEGRFEYTIASDPDDTKAFLSGSTLNVPTGLKAGTYEITVTATEKAPAYSLMSVESYGVEPVTLTVQVDIGPHYSTFGSWVIDETTGQHYKVCAVCNKDFERSSHSWTLQSTDETTGDKTYACEICHAKKVVEGGKFCVSGKILESDGTTPSGGTPVTLKRGGETVAESVTDSEGRYSFPGVEPGIYDLVVGDENGITTALVEVADDAELADITELPENVSSVLEVTGDETPAVVVGGLDDVARESVEAGKTVTVTMTVEAVTDGAAGNSPDLQSSIDAIKSASASSGHEYLDLTIEKTVSEAGAGDVITEITETTSIITVVIPFDPSGKSNIVVYRYHSGSVDTLTRDENSDGEYIDVGDSAVTVYAKNFSTYAIGYTQEGKTSGASGTPSYSITIPSKTEGGIVGSSLTAARPGSSVTLTARPDDGYHLGSLTVTDGSGRAVELMDNGDGTYTFTMPYGQVAVKAEFVKCGSMEFTDVDVKAWYHDYTDYVIGCGLMHGVGGSLFDPNGAVTRAQMVTVLWNMSGDPVVNYYMTYSDVSESAWYAEAIRWATSEGVVDGYGNGLFGPNDLITREQMATMLYRYEKKYGDGGFTGEWMYRLPFTDLDQISDWAFEAVAWCNIKGIITGKDGNRVDPKGSAKRCEMAAVLTRYRYENDTENDTE